MFISREEMSVEHERDEQAIRTHTKLALQARLIKKPIIPRRPIKQFQSNVPNKSCKMLLLRIKKVNIYNKITNIYVWYWIVIIIYFNRMVSFWPGFAIASTWLHLSDFNDLNNEMIWITRCMTVVVACRAWVTYILEIFVWEIGR